MKTYSVGAAAVVFALALNVETGRAATLVYNDVSSFNAATTGQVFASADEGASWSEIASYLPAISSVEVATFA